MFLAGDGWVDLYLRVLVFFANYIDFCKITTNKKKRQSIDAAFNCFPSVQKLYLGGL